LPIEKLVALMEALRAPNGCPWDREQTHASLKKTLVEECYETLEAIDLGDDQALKEELGDLLLHVVFHSQIAAESRRFNLDDVINHIIYKLTARHPHVFEPYPELGAETQRMDARTTDEVLANWEALKAKEKKERTSAMDGLPKGLPALMRAQKMQERAARLGFDWPDTAPIIDKIQEELDEWRAEWRAGHRENMEEELGDLLFSAVNLARALKMDSESLMNAAADKFEKRFRLMETSLKTRGKTLKDCSLDEMEDEWQKAKRKKKGSG